MNKKISLNLYRSIDIFVFSLIGILFEYLSFRMLSYYDYPFFSVSVSILMALLIMKRWGKYSLIYPLISGLFYVYLIKGNINNYIVYGIGNLFILFDLIFLYKKQEQINNNILFNILFILNGFLLVCIGRSVVSMFFKNNFFDMLLAFLGTESLNIVFSVIILNLLRKIDGLYEDQVEYIKRINLEVRYET